MWMRQEHTLEPVYYKDSKVLILGSFPSIVSRKNLFYYAHPQNRFWKVMSIIFDEEIIDRKEFLKSHKIALWDVISSCEINGSSDSSIKNVIPNDISLILENTNVKCIFTVGRTAYNLYNKYIFKDVNVEAMLLPSTSPANAQKKLEDLVQDFRIILDYL